MGNNENFILNNVLCFINSSWNDYDRVALHDIVFTFYSDADIIEAKNLICEISETDLQLRRDPNRKKRDLSDILDIFDKIKKVDSPCKDFIFVSDDSKKLPPSGYDTISPALSSLMNEVIEVRHSYDNLSRNMNELTQQVGNLIQNNDIFKLLNDDVNTCKLDLLDIKHSITSLMRATLGNQVRRLSTMSNAPYFDKLNSTSESIESGVVQACCNDQSVLQDVISDAKFSEPTIVVDNCPSAPPLSQLEADDINKLSDQKQIVHSKTFIRSSNKNDINLPTKDSQKPRFYSSVAAIIPENKNKNETSNYKDPYKKPPSVLAKNSFSNFPKNKIVDEDGYTKISYRRRRSVTTTGTKKNFGTSGFRSADKFIELYIGRCEESMTANRIRDYLISELEVTPKSCKQINTKVMYASAFKVVVNIGDKSKLFSPNSWPEGVICCKFVPSKNLNNID